MRIKINQGDGDKDEAAPAIDSDVIRILVTAVTKAMVTTIANSTVPNPVTPNTITHSSAINPYNNETLETNTKEGK